MAMPAAPHPAIGVWKLNLNKSSFRLVPTASVLRVEPWGNGLQVSANTNDVQRKTLHPTIAYKFDGRDYPLKGSPLADTISAKRINQRTSENVWKKHGKVVLTVRIVVSKDGKTLSLTRTSPDGQEQMVQEVMVYDRQKPERALLALSQGARF